MFGSKYLMETHLIVTISLVLLPASECFAGTGVQFSPSLAYGLQRRGFSFQPPATVLPMRSFGLKKGPATVLPVPVQREGAVTTMSLSPETIFQINNYLPVPFWFMMIFTPRAAWTRKIMSSWLPFLPLIVIYFLTLVMSLTSPGGLDVFNGPITLATLSKAGQAPSAMAAIWAHIIVWDLFVGRWILFDSLRNRIFAVHSLILAFLFGPLGLLSHLVTRAILGGSKAVDGVTDGLLDAMSDQRLMELVDED